MSDDGKTITFRDEGCITEENVQEELIHSGGGIRGTLYFNSQTNQERYLTMVTNLLNGGSISISEFNSLCNVWYYPYIGANNYCSFSFSPDACTGIISGNFINGSISY